MARSKGTFQPGQSGNPKGRPPKDRALTTILERAGSKTVSVDSVNVSGKQLVARLVWEGITTRQVTFPDGDKIKLQPYHWLELVKWAYGQIDGPPKGEMNVNQAGEIVIRVVYDDVEVDTAAPTFSTETRDERSEAI